MNPAGDIDPAARVEDNGKTAGESLLFLRMNAVCGQMFLVYGHPKRVFVNENQKNIALNVQNIQFLIDNLPKANYTIP